MCSWERWWDKRWIEAVKTDQSQAAKASPFQRSRFHPFVARAFARCVKLTWFRKFYFLLFLRYLQTTARYYERACEKNYSKTEQVSGHTLFKNQDLINQTNLAGRPHSTTWQQKPNIQVFCVIRLWNLRPVYSTRRNSLYVWNHEPVVWLEAFFETLLNFQGVYYCVAVNCSAWQSIS